MALVKSLPASESGPGVLYRTKSGDEYIISQNPANGKFTLWRDHGKDGYEKLTTGTSPLDLYPKIPN